MSAFNENTVEQATLEWLRSMGYEYQFGPDIAPGESKAERESYREVLLLGRLKVALVRLNPGVPQAALDEAIRKITTPEHPSLMQNNRAIPLREARLELPTDGMEPLFDGMADECYGMCGL